MVPNGKHPEELHFEFRSFPGLEICCTILSCDAGQRQGATASGQPFNQVVHIRYTDHGVPAQPFCFLLSIQYSTHSIRFSALYYRMDFRGDDFAQMQADGSDLSTFKVD